MADMKRVIVGKLEELDDDDLRKFAWHLWNEFSPDVAPIAKFKLVRQPPVTREDVVDIMVQQYSSKTGGISVQVLQMMNQNHLAGLLQSALEKDSQPVNSPRQETEKLESDWQRPCGITLTDPELRRQLSEKTDQIYNSREKSQRRRYALLITNIHFSEAEYNRHGAERDEENMDWLLKALGYTVVEYRDLTGDAIKQAVEGFAEGSKHQHSDGTFVVIMSHGLRINNKDAVTGVNYHPTKNSTDVYFIEEIFSSLNAERCSELRDKPKIILVQACRGKEFGGVMVKEIQSDAWKHKEKDFACFMSCVPHVRAFRHTIHGSFFITHLVDVFCSSAHNSHIMDLFRQIASRMENDPNFKGEMKILPCIERTSLTKEFYLFPGF